MTETALANVEYVAVPEIVVNGFRLTQTGLMPVGEPSFAEWQSCGAWLKYAEKTVGFWVGDWLNYGERKWGEMYSQELQESTGLSYATLRQYKWVSEQVELSNRLDNLTFKHHLEVASLEPSEQKELLTMASDEGLNSAKFEKVVRDYKKTKRLADLPDAPRWTGDGELDTVTIADIATLELPPRSVDLIFTDPPYHDEYLNLYDHLGRVAAAVLKPGAYLMTYCGKMFLPQVIDSLRAHLEYVWCFGAFQPDNAQKINKYHLFEAWRPILCFKQDGPTETRDWQPDMIRATRQKDFHEWQQADEPALKYISAYTLPGQVVLDPFVGGGTTVVSCVTLKRHYLGFDKDPNAVKTTIARLNGQR